MDYGVGDEEIPFYVMEYLEGESLGDLISDRSLTLPKFLKLARQICLGLECAHQGIPFKGEINSIIHRDIKPGNILICQDPTMGDLVKILDFGIAKLLQSDGDQTSSFMGTLAYSSPEQMEGKDLDNRADIYSLGILMYEMLLNKMPLYPDSHTFGSWYKAHHFQPPRPFCEADPHSNHPKALESLVMSCLAKAPADRPQTVSDILQRLDEIERSLTTPPSSPTTPPTPNLSATGSFAPSLPTTPPIPVVTNSLAPPPTPPAAVAAVSIEQACLMALWPSNMPVAEIVFPQVVYTGREAVASLWIMLHQQDIQNRWVCTRYNQFLFLESPHPMLLWATVLYSRQHGPRWLPCYLDLKTSKGQELVRLLGDKGQYQLLFFPWENPHRCVHVMSSTISAFQGPLLKEWANSSQINTTDQAPLSKSVLRAEFEKLKPKILMKLESSYVDGWPEAGSDLAG